MSNPSNNNKKIDKFDCIDDTNCNSKRKLDGIESPENEKKKSVAQKEIASISSFFCNCCSIYHTEKPKFPSCGHSCCFSCDNEKKVCQTCIQQKNMNLAEILICKNCAMYVRTKILAPCGHGVCDFCAIKSISGCVECFTQIKCEIMIPFLKKMNGIETLTCLGYLDDPERLERDIHDSSFSMSIDSSENTKEELVDIIENNATCKGCDQSIVDLVFGSCGHFICLKCFDYRYKENVELRFEDQTGEDDLQNKIYNGKFSCPNPECEQFSEIVIVTDFFTPFLVQKDITFEFKILHPQREPQIVRHMKKCCANLTIGDLGEEIFFDWDSQILKNKLTFNGKQIFHEQTLWLALGRFFSEKWKKEYIFFELDLSCQNQKDNK